MLKVTKKVWDTHKAKDQLSQLLSAAQEDEQIILRYGKPIAVVISYDEYTKNIKNRKPAWHVFETISLDESLNLPERDETMRDVVL